MEIAHCKLKQLRRAGIHSILNPPRMGNTMIDFEYDPELVEPLEQQSTEMMPRAKTIRKPLGQIATLI